MNIVTVNQSKSTRFRNNVRWSIIAIFMTIGFASAIASGNLLYLALALLPFLAYFFVMKPFVCLFGLYCFLVPFDSILVVSGEAHGATITKLLGITIIMALFMTGLFEKKIMKPDKIVIWWGLFVFWGVLSLFWAVEPKMAISRIPTVLGLFLMYLIVSSYRIEEKDFSVVTKFVIYGGVTASIYTIVSYFFGGTTFHDSQRAILAVGERSADPNLFAYSLLIPFALSLNYVLTERKKLVRVFAWAFLGVIAFAILISGSRGALLGTVIIALTFLLSKAKKRMLIPAIITSFVLFYFSPEMVFERISRAVETGGAGRLDIWSAGLAALKYNWLSGYYGLVGVGLDNFPTIFLQFGPVTSTGGASHNIFLGTMTEFGIIGFLFMAIAIYKHYALAVNKYNRYDHKSDFLKAALFGLMISAFFLDVTWKKSFWLLWMLMVMYDNVGKAKFRPAKSRR